MLMSVTIFEGYDVTIFHLCTPDIAKTFHLDDRAVGTMASFVRLGGMISFSVVMLSGIAGRKPMMSVTVLFYTRVHISHRDFARAGELHPVPILRADFSFGRIRVAIVMISEEFPDSSRGRGVALLHMVGLLGVVAGGFLYGRVADSSFGWRGMYFIGIVPLLLVAFMRRSLRETGRFRAMRDARSPTEPRVSERWRLDRPCVRSAFVALIEDAYSWSHCFGIRWAWSGLPAVTFFSLYAKRDHHWTSARLGRPWCSPMSLAAFGHLAAGWMLDRIGRKATLSLSYVLGAIIDARVVPDRAPMPRC